MKENVKCGLKHSNRKYAIINLRSSAFICGFHTIFNKNYSRKRDSLKQERTPIPNQENRWERGVTQSKSIRTGSFQCS